MTTSRLSALGVHGFERLEPLVLASLVTEDPLLLIGHSGTGKTFLLNTLSEALGLAHRHYNASLISFDDLVGFPYPEADGKSVRFLETPATVWHAESVLFDELSRCRPEHQNRLFSLVHERRLQGLPLTKLRYRWAAMNPCGADQEGAESYTGSEPLDPALADRFSLIIESGDWSSLGPDAQRAITAPVGEGLVTAANEALRRDVAAWRECFLAQLPNCPARIIEYVTTAVTALNGAAVRISPRRARLIARSLLAVTIVTGGHTEDEYRATLEASLPQPAFGQQVAGAVVAAAHRAAWDCSQAAAGSWIHRFLLAPTLVEHLQILIDTHPTPDEGSQAIAQLIAQATPERSAAFAFATYPAAAAGHLPIGAEGVHDLAKVARPLLDAKGTVGVRTGNKDWATSEVAKQLGTRIAGLKGKRRERAMQFFTACLIHNTRIADPQALEVEINACVELLGSRIARAGAAA